MAKSRPRPGNLAKRGGADPGEYFLLIALIALIIGVIVIHIAHLRFP